MRRPLCIVCLVFVLLIIGIVEFFPYEYEFPKELSGEVVLVEGTVKGKEIKSQNGQTTYYIYLKPIMSQSASEAENISDRNPKSKKLNKAEGILCYMANNTYVPNIGSHVQIKGKVSVFETPDNPGEFNAPLYYKIKGIDLKMYDCSLENYGKNYEVINFENGLPEEFSFHPKGKSGVILLNDDYFFNIRFFFFHLYFRNGNRLNRRNFLKNDR